MIQDFKLNPSFNIHFDAMEYHAKFTLMMLLKLKEKKLQQVILALLLQKYLTVGGSIF
ncbi:hypothetical protein [Nostoc sp. CCY 9925]|uniref:hypothetical protein n=1 Tax=Nostoc sp. CCY 9925 TaxID=3103865 RepID=UPI0039C5F623